MYIQPFIFQGFGVIIVCCLVVIALFIFLYIRVNRGYSLLKTEFTLYKRDNEKNAREALEAANIKAKEIINSTSLFTNEMKSAVTNSIDASLLSGKTAYEQILTDIGNKNTKDLISYAGTLKESMNKNAASLTNNYQKELEEERASFHTSVEAGEQKILEDIKLKSVQMLPAILKEALAKSISPEDVEKLVLESIEKIKKEYGFH